MAVTVHRLGMALGAEGNDERAGEVFARAVRLCEKAFGKGSSQVAESMHGLGVSLFRRVGGCVGGWMFCAGSQQRVENNIL